MSSAFHRKSSPFPPAATIAALLPAPGAVASRPRWGMRHHGALPLAGVATYPPQARQLPCDGLPVPSPRPRTRGGHRRRGRREPPFDRRCIGVPPPRYIAVSALPRARLLSRLARPLSLRRAITKKNTTD